VATYVVRIVVCVYVSVCLRVEHQDVLNRSICRWEEGAESCGSKEPYIRRGSKSPTGKALLRGHAYNVTNAFVHRVRRAATFASGGRQTTRNVMMCRHQRIARCSPAATGECACPAHAVDKCIRCH